MYTTTHCNNLDLDFFLLSIKSKYIYIYIFFKSKKNSTNFLCVVKNLWKCEVEFCFKCSTYQLINYNKIRVS